MNSAVMFSKATDEWTTPDDFWRALDAEFHFDVDAAATRENSKCEEFHSKATDALQWPWTFGTYWLNPPYSQCRQFIAKAAQEARINGVTVVCLVPARTDTRWFHEHIYNATTHQYRPGVEVRFVKGRLVFLGPDGKPICDKHGRPTGAPFPSMVVIFRPVEAG